MTVSRAAVRTRTSRTTGISSAPHVIDELPAAPHRKEPVVMTPASVLGVLALTIVPPAARQSAPANLPVAGSYRTDAERWLTPNPKFRAAVHLDMSGKKVRIAWEYSHTGVFNFNDGVPSDELLDQEIAVGYWPTAADAVATDKLVVAGRDRTGGTRIELWLLDVPTVKTAQVPGRRTPYQLIAKPIRDIT